MTKKNYYGIKTMNAYSVAKEIQSMSWEEDCFPVDPVSISKTLGIQVFETRLPKTTSSAILKELGHDARIVVDTNDSQNRKRYAIAQKLGYYISQLEYGIEEFDYVDFRTQMVKQENQHNKKETERNPQTRFANHFADELLMPEKHFKRLWAKYKSIIVLSIQFGVSTEVVQNRVIDLKL